MENGNRIGCSLIEAHSQKALLDWVLNEADEEIRTLDPLLGKEMVRCPRCQMATDIGLALAGFCAPNRAPERRWP